MASDLIKKTKFHQDNASRVLEKYLNSWQELKVSQAAHPSQKQSDYKPAALFTLIEINCTDEQVLKFIQLWITLKRPDLKLYTNDPDKAKAEIL